MSPTDLPSSFSPTHRCELCALPYRRANGHCDRCGHLLGTEPDWRAIHTEVSRLRFRLPLGVLSSVVLVWMVLTEVYQMAAIILLTPLTLWAFVGVYRHRSLAQALARHEQQGKPDP